MPCHSYSSNSVGQHQHAGDHVKQAGLWVVIAANTPANSAKTHDFQPNMAAYLSQRMEIQLDDVTPAIELLNSSLKRPGRLNWSHLLATLSWPVWVLCHPICPWLSCRHLCATAANPPTW